MPLVEEQIHWNGKFEKNAFCTEVKAIFWIKHSYNYVENFVLFSLSLQLIINFSKGKVATKTKNSMCLKHIKTKALNLN